MQPELELVRQWMERAKVDLRSAQADLAANPPITEDACFHCQQVAEKTLKAFLVFHSAEFEYTHEIERLIEQCAAIDPSFISLHETADHLTNYAVRFRYPYWGAAPDMSKTRDSLSAAKQVWLFVASRIPSETVPKI